MQILNRKYKLETYKAIAFGRAMTAQEMGIFYVPTTPLKKDCLASFSKQTSKEPLISGPTEKQRSQHLTSKSSDTSNEVILDRTSGAHGY